MDRHGTVRRHDIAHAGNRLRLQRPGERNRRGVDDRIDAIGEFDDQGGVTRGHDAERVRHLRRSRPGGLERPQELLMNPAESAVRHQHDEIARPMFAEHRFDDVVERFRTRGRTGRAGSDRRRAAAPTTAPPREASIETREQSAPRWPVRTRARSRPGRCDGTMTPTAVRRPPRSAPSGWRRGGRRASRPPRSGDGRSRRRPSRRGRCRPLPAAASRRQTAAGLRRSAAAPIPTSAAIAIAAVALRTLWAPTSGTVERPVGRPVPRCTLNVVELPVDSRSCACQSTPSEVPNVSTRDFAAARQTARPLAVGAEEQQSAARDQIDQPTKCQRHRLDIGIDIRVIELDVVDDRDVRQILQELGGLVEEGAVVLVAFDDKVATAAPSDSSSRARRRFRAMPPTRMLGSAPACVSSHPASAVVVVFPCVPAITIERAPHRKCSRIASGSEQ